MPVISRFFGIIIFMYWKDHSPPHFHAKYQNQEIIMEISSGKITGQLSKKAIELINEWRKIHKEELLSNWHLAENNNRLKKIEPLE